MSALLVLGAFSSGAIAMTGVEAVSNAVPAFKPVERRNARTTLTWMVALLTAMFAGVERILRLSAPDLRKSRNLPRRHAGISDAPPR